MKSFIADKNRKLSKLALNNIEDLSYTAFMRALRKKDVKVNGKRVLNDLTLNVGDKVEIYYVSNDVEKFTIVYEDENVLIIDKKSGFTSESVFETIKEKYATAGFIHRLDRNTEGLMIFSLNDKAEIELLEGFKKRAFTKKYLAHVVGIPDKKEAVLTAYLFKDSKKSIVTITDKHVVGCSPIKTGYTLIKNYGKTSLLEVELYTGKTHQIRAHLAHVGYPIVGDEKYGDFSFNQKQGKTRQELTSYKITLHFEKDAFLSYLSGKTFTANREY